MNHQFPVTPRAILLSDDRIPLIIRRCGRDEKFWRELANEAIFSRKRYYVVVNYPEAAFYTTFVILNEDEIRREYEFDERAIETWFTKLYAK